MTRVALAALAVALLGGCATSASLGSTEVPLTDADLVMAFTRADLTDADDFTEQMKIVVALEGGGEVYTRLFVTNLASADGRADLLAKVLLPAGTRELEDDLDLRAKFEAERGEWKAGADRFEAHIGEGSMTVSTTGAEVRVDADTFTMSYTVRSEVPSLRPKGGVADRGGAVYVTTIPVPRGVVEGSVTVKATDETPARTYPLRGVAFVEHRYGNLAPYRLAKRWFKLNEVTPERTTILSAWQWPEAQGGRIQGWLMVADASGLVAYEGDLLVAPTEWAVDSETGYEVPGLVYLYDPDKTRLRAIIQARGLTEKKDELARLNRLERFVVRQLMKPWTFMFDEARYLIKTRAAPQAPERAVRGATPFEYQQLNE